MFLTWIINNFKSHMDESIKVLIIDDDPILVFLLKKMIVNQELFEKPISFENGQLGLDFLKQDFRSCNRYVIFLDINMPVMDGWMFLEELSKVGGKEQLQVYMVSSSTDKADVERAMSSPYTQDYLIKPITPEKIRSIKATLSESQV